MQATPCPDPNPLGIFRPESKATWLNRFVGDLDAPASQDPFEVSEAQRKSMVKLNRMADLFSGMPETSVQICVVAHGITLPRVRQPDSTMTRYKRGKQQSGRKATNAEGRKNTAGSKKSKLPRDESSNAYLLLSKDV